ACARRGSGTPFFFCHGDFLTRGFWALRLASLLGHDQPVFLLHPYRDTDIDPETTMETMARSYVPHLLAAQPNGVFRLGGFCNGGLLAWEIAHQLASAGRKVEFVVLVETLSLNAQPTFRAMERRLRSKEPAAPNKPGQEVKLDMCAVWNRARQDSRTGDPVAYPIEVAQSAARFYPVMTNYVPPKIDSAVICVVCEGSQRKIEFSQSCWRDLASEVHCEQISGGHHNCVTTHLSELADLLRPLLEEGCENAKRTWRTNSREKARI